MAPKTLRALILLAALTSGIVIASPVSAAVFRDSRDDRSGPAYSTRRYSYQPQVYSEGGFGYQMLGYQEHVGDFLDTGVSQGRLDSNSSPANIIFSGTTEWWLPNGLVLGTFGEYPGIRVAATETWKKGDGSVYQTNRLSYGIIKIRGYMGYPFANWMEPIAGVQISLADQIRNNFVTKGVPDATGASADEKIQALSWVLGLRGRGATQDPWGGGWRTYYHVIYTSAFNVQTTNDRVQGGARVFSSPGGSLEGKATLGYSFNPSMTLSASAGYVSTWYDGTGATNRTDTIWPQNATQDWTVLFQWSSTH